MLFFSSVNKLNQKFQHDHVDITSIASTVDAKAILGPKFSKNFKILKKFLRKVVPTDYLC
jgi:hypothetical protein